MSVPPEMMGAAPAGANTGGDEPSPGAAPTMTPQEPKGDKTSGDVKVEIAIRFLEEALVAHGHESDKGKELRRTIGSLRKAFKFHDQATEVMASELKAGLLASAGGPPEPVAKAA